MMSKPQTFWRNGGKKPTRCIFLFSYDVMGRIRMTPVDLVLIGIAAIAAGTVNAVAGGGTLITFPVLTALGIPPVAANITNTVALSPGYLGGTLAQAGDLKDQKTRLWLFIPIGILGGILGGLLLLNTGERLFRQMVPVLILLASALLAVQDRIRLYLQKRKGEAQGMGMHLWGVIPALLAAVYGGYFGAGVSVIVLAVLGLMLDDSLTRLNALKQAMSFAINAAAAVFFLFSGKVVWIAAIVMATGSVLGGILGGKLASRIRPATLRWTVVFIGLIVSIIYFVQR